MGTENFNQTPENDQSKPESIGEELATEQLQEIVEQVQASLDKDSEHDADRHWTAAVYRLSVAMGKEDVSKSLENLGWNKDSFPTL